MAKSKRKHKKKKINYQQLEGQRKNEYKRKIVRLAKLCGAEDALPWIPKKDWELIMDTRFRAVRVEMGNDLVPKQLLASARKQLDYHLLNGRIQLIDDGYQMSFKDYVSVALHIYYYVNEIKHRCPLVVKEKFFRLIEAVEGAEYSPINILMQISTMIGIEIGRVHRRMYYCTYKIEEHDTYINETLYLHGFQHHKRKISIGKETRLAYRLGWCLANRGIDWSQVTGAQFGYHNALSELPVHVYVQAHALQRLKERLDMINASYLHFYLYLALENPRVARTKSGQQLIEFYYNSKKLGYLAFDLIGTNLIIRTFLFLTMDGTPEGEALQDMLGICAEDKKYLAIDRLSTFIISDIKSNPEVKQHFINAGCGQLFEWKDIDYSMFHEVKQATMIQSYLGLHQAPAATSESDDCSGKETISLSQQEPLLLPQSRAATA